MSNSFSAADLRTVLRFPFQAKGWLNHFLVGSALFFANAFVPFIPVIFAYGYLARLLRNTANGQPLTMPEWNDWGGLFKDGLRSMAVGLLYLGPSTIVMVGGGFIYFAAMMTVAFTAESGATDTATSPFFILWLGAFFIFFISMFLGWLLWTLGAVPLPLALAHSAARQQFLAAFDLRVFGKIIRADKWGYLLSWVIVMGLFGVIYTAFMLMYFTVVLCVFSYILITPLAFYVMLVAAAVFGNFYRENMPTPSVPSVQSVVSAAEDQTN